jgi:hypothetical protein
MTATYEEIRTAIKNINKPEDMKLLLETLGNRFGFTRYNLYQAGKLFDQTHPAVQDAVAKGLIAFLVGYALRDNAYVDGRNKDITLFCRNLTKAIDNGEIEPYNLGMFVPYSEKE